MRRMLGNLFSWTVTALFGVIFVALVFESWALLTGNKPITDYIRPAVHSYPGYAFVIAVVIGVLLGHFLWGPARGRTSPSGREK
jgi:uncharacterized membrane protein SpoIIM required for sporulation